MAATKAKKTAKTKTKAKVTKKKVEKKSLKTAKPKAKATMKKANTKKVKKPLATKTKASKKVAKSSLKQKIIKTAKKVIKTVKGPTPAQLKALKEKEKKRLLKEKQKLAQEKKKAQLLAKKEKELAKKKLEAEKKAQKEAKAKAKEDAKLLAKMAKQKAKEDKRKAKLGIIDDEEVKASSENDEDFDEFEEDYKKSKSSSKSGKKAYENDEDHDLDVFAPKSSKKYSNSDLAELESKISDKIADLREHFNWKEIQGAIATLDFFVDPKNDECIERGCDNIRTTQSYCRTHYVKNWKKIQLKKEILKEGKLEDYIEELISKYPPKFIEALLSDLSDEKDFYKVLNELNITSEFDFDEELVESVDNDDVDDDDIGIESRFTGAMRYEHEG